MIPEKIDRMFIKLCREHPERVTREEAGLIERLLRAHKPRIRVKAISRRVH